VAERRELKRWIRVVHLDMHAVIFDFEDEGCNPRSMQNGVIDEFGGEQFHRFNHLGSNAFETGPYDLPCLGRRWGGYAFATRHNPMVLLTTSTRIPRRLFPNPAYPRLKTG
jgi:hypothetical protein